MSRDPFRIEGPALISYSSGRTSAYLLWRTLQAHGGVLPANVHAVLANTGKERNESLDFAHECGERWGVDITWVEYDPTTEPRFRVVSYETASRKGEPFEALIRKKSFLPNPVMRFCTIELKIRPMRDFMRAQGYEHWDCAIGFRADEPHRIAKGKTNREQWENTFPLAEAGVTLADIRAFWKQQPFDLQLEEWEGNCDLCFLKGRQKKVRIAQDRPDLVPWWAEMEVLAKGTFRKDGPDYRQIAELASRPTLFPLLASDGGAIPDAEDDIADCTCGDWSAGLELVTR